MLSEFGFSNVLGLLRAKALRRRREIALRLCHLCVVALAVFTAAEKHLPADAPNFAVSSCQRQLSSLPIWLSLLPPVARDVPA